MIKLSDQQLVDQLKSGDTTVFKVLYKDFDLITSFIRKNSGSEEDARDIFHEALIVFYEKIKKNEFELKSKLSTYLFSVCRNLWLYFLRDNKPLIYNNLRTEVKDIVQQDHSFDVEQEHNEKEEKIKTIMDGIERLKEPCYSILMMFYFKKMSFKAIAEAMDYKTEKVVKNQKYRCIQKLKDSLPADFYDL